MHTNHLLTYVKGHQHAHGARNRELEGVLDKIDQNLLQAKAVTADHLGQIFIFEQLLLMVQAIGGLEAEK